MPGGDDGAGEYPVSKAVEAVLDEAALPLPPRNTIAILRRTVHTTARVTAAISAVFAALLLLLFCYQRHLVYYPQRYVTDPARVLPADRGNMLTFTTSQGSQTAFYIAPRTDAKGMPGKIWVMFHGNAALALSWLDTVEKCPDASAGFLLVDYPGYGLCEGFPTEKLILENSEKAMDALAAHLATGREELHARMSVMGYSIGTGAALQFAARHPVERVVLIAPFTRLRDSVRHILFWPVDQVLFERWDNIDRIAELAARPKPPHVAVICGDIDRIAPPKMGRQLAEQFPKMVSYVEIPNASHGLLISTAQSRILKEMAPGI